MAATRKNPRVLLIGWDAADWQHIDPLLDQGLLPNLERLIDRGVIGNLATMEPVFSPMLWNTIATGKMPDEHGILGFMEPDPVNGGMRPMTSLSRKVKAIWNMLSQEGMNCNVIGWWASHPAEPIRGQVVTQNFRFAKQRDGKLEYSKGSIHPVSAEASFEHCRVFPHEIKAEDVLPFIPDAAEIDQANDPKLGTFVKLLTECATIQAAATQSMSNDDWDFTAVYFDAIDHFCHAFMEFAPPQMAHVKDTDFKFYQHVISGVYRFHDMMLGALWQLAGGDEALVCVCSDHGFLSGDARPIAISNEPAGPAEWHREMGIIAMAGPGIKQDERIYGANLIDITPTLLAYLDLPIGEDMKGRPLTGAFAEEKEISTISSWEDRPGDAGMHPPGTQLDEEQTDELRKQFVALGYVDDHGKDHEKAHRQAQIELDYNLARVYIGSKRSDEAIPLLEKLLRDDPWEVRFIIRLAQAYFLSGYYQQCNALIAKAFPESETVPTNVRMLRGRALLALGDEEQALRDFEVVRKQNARMPQLYIQLGRIYLQRGDIEQSIAAFQQALDINPETAIAFQGLAHAYLKARQNEAAAEAALSAVGLIHHLPRAHFYLGVALCRLGEYERAALAFETTLHINPGYVKAHRWLHRLHSRFLRDTEKAGYHQGEVALVSAAQRQEVDDKEARKEVTFDLPEIPDRKTRRATLMRERPQGGKSHEPSGRTMVLVSGLPRSGTSLMMQMLKAGGLLPMTDEVRAADVDNPEGYMEWEPIKELLRNPAILDDPLLDERATKVISMLLPGLPEQHQYKIIFLVRNIAEVAASQAKMISRLGQTGANQPVEQLSKELREHRDQVLKMLREKPNVELLVVNFSALVETPAPIIDELVDFLGNERLPTHTQMEAAVRPELHRNRLPNE